MAPASYVSPQQHRYMLSRYPPQIAATYEKAKATNAPNLNIDQWWNLIGKQLFGPLPKEVGISVHIENGYPTKMMVKPEDPLWYRTVCSSIEKHLGIDNVDIVDITGNPVDQCTADQLKNMGDLYVRINNSTDDAHFKRRSPTGRAAIPPVCLHPARDSCLDNWFKEFGDKVASHLAEKFSGMNWKELMNAVCNKEQLVHTIKGCIKDRDLYGKIAYAYSDHETPHILFFNDMARRPGSRVDSNACCDIIAKLMADQIQPSFENNIQKIKEWKIGQERLALQKEAERNPDNARLANLFASLEYGGSHDKTYISEKALGTKAQLYKNIIGDGFMAPGVRGRVIHIVMFGKPMKKQKMYHTDRDSDSDSSCSSISTCSSSSSSPCSSDSEDDGLSGYYGRVVPHAAAKRGKYCKRRKMPGLVPIYEEIDMPSKPRPALIPISELTEAGMWGDYDDRGFDEDFDDEDFDEDLDDENFGGVEDDFDENDPDEEDFGEEEDFPESMPSLLPMETSVPDSLPSLRPIKSDIPQSMPSLTPLQDEIPESMPSLAAIQQNAAQENSSMPSLVAIGKQVEEESSMPSLTAIEAEANESLPSLLPIRSTANDEAEMPSLLPIKHEEAASQDSMPSLVALKNGVEDSMPSLTTFVEDSDEDDTVEESLPSMEPLQKDEPQNPFVARKFEISNDLKDLQSHDAAYTHFCNYVKKKPSLLQKKIFVILVPNKHVKKQYGSGGIKHYIGSAEMDNSSRGWIKCKTDSGHMFMIYPSGKMFRSGKQSKFSHKGIVILDSNPNVVFFKAGST